MVDTFGKAEFTEGSGCRDILHPAQECTKAAQPGMIGVLVAPSQIS